MMQVGSEQQLQLAAQANEAQTDIALQKAQAQQGVNFREAQAQRDFRLMQLQGAQGAAAQSDMNKRAAIAGAVQGIGTAVGIAGKGIDAYKKDRQKSWEKQTEFEAPTWEYLYNQEGEIDWGSPE
jgi:hypothetical protein